MAPRIDRFRELEPAHPGDLLDAALEGLGVPLTVAAKHLKVSRQTLHRIRAGSAPVSANMAARLGKLCGNGPAIWLRMQAAHDLWRAETELKEVLAQIPDLSAA